MDVSGMGGALVISASYISVTQWFDKKKGKAMSLSSLGAGFASICMAPLVTMLVKQYGFFGTVLIVGSLVLNNSVGGALYRPQPVTPEKRICPDTSADDEEPAMQTELSGEVIYLESYEKSSLFKEMTGRAAV